jgi:hypothetical protein
MTFTTEDIYLGKRGGMFPWGGLIEPKLFNRIEWLFLSRAKYIPLPVLTNSMVGKVENVALAYGLVDVDVITKGIDSAIVGKDADVVTLPSNQVSVGIVTKGVDSAVANTDADIVAVAQKLIETVILTDGVDVAVKGKDVNVSPN